MKTQREGLSASRSPQLSSRGGLSLTAPHRSGDESRDPGGPSPEVRLFLALPPRLAVSHPFSHLPSGAQGHTSSCCPRDGRLPGTQIPRTDGKLVKGIQRPQRRWEGRRGAAAWGEGKQVGSAGLSPPAAACPASPLKRGWTMLDTCWPAEVETHSNGHPHILCVPGTRAPFWL